MRVRELTESGWTASEASRAVLAGEVAVVPAPLAVPAPLTEEGAHARQAELIARFVEVARVMDISATGAALDEMFALGSFESIVDDLLMPALVALGNAWSEGELDVAAEHAASAAVHRRLSALYEAAASVSDPLVVVGLPPGSRHELGALAFAVAVRRLGVGVLYLGADVPVASWVHVMRAEPRARRRRRHRAEGGPGRARSRSPRPCRRAGPAPSWQSVASAPAGRVRRKPVSWCFLTASTKRPPSLPGWRTRTIATNVGRGSQGHDPELAAHHPVGLKLTVLGSSAAWSERPVSAVVLLHAGDSATRPSSSIWARARWVRSSPIATPLPSRPWSSATCTATTTSTSSRFATCSTTTTVSRGESACTCPPGCVERYDAFMGEEGFLDFMVGPDVIEGIRQIGPFTVEARPVTHSQNSHAFRVSDEADPDGPGLVYSGDCGRADDLLPLIHEGDTVLCEAFWSTRDPSPVPTT